MAENDIIIIEMIIIIEQEALDYICLYNSYVNLVITIRNEMRYISII